MKNNLEKEKVLCHLNFPYFWDNLKLFDKLWPVEERLIKTYQNNKYVIFKDYTRSGFPGITLTYAIWRSIFYKEKVLWFGTEKTNEKVKRIYEKQKQQTNWVGWKDIVFASETDQVRGLNCTLTIINECAVIPQMQEKWQAIWPMYPKAIILSEPGENTWFDKVYWEVNHNSFVSFIYGKEYLIQKIK